MQLIKNSIWNLLGYILPAIATIISFGVIGRTLGLELFGIFSLILAVIGYSSIFDLGLTRSVIREIAIYKNNHEEKKHIISSSSSIVLILGFLSGVAIFLFKNNILIILNIHPNHYHSVLYSLAIVSIIIPIFLLNQIWLSILEGEEKFGILNIYKSFSGAFISLTPAIFLLINPALEYAILGLFISRLFCLITTFFLCKKEILKSGLRPNKRTIKRLFFFGSWITMSNIVSPIMAYFDRFIISNKLGASSVALYAAPAEIISKLSMFPGAFSRAIYPYLSSNRKTEEKKHAKKTITYILCVFNIPIVIIFSLFSQDILKIWLGNSFGSISADVLQILLLGYFFNSLAQIPFSSLQSLGLAKITALVHLIELVPYVILLFSLLKNMGVIGAAYAWSIRMLIDYMILLYLDKKYS